jgi:hypothetical protein
MAYAIRLTTCRSQAWNQWAANPGEVYIVVPSQDLVLFAMSAVRVASNIFLLLDRMAASHSSSFLLPPAPRAGRTETRVSRPPAAAAPTAFLPLTDWPPRLRSPLSPTCLQLHDIKRGCPALVRARSRASRTSAFASASFFVCYCGRPGCLRRHSVSASAN